MIEGSTSPSSGPHSTPEEMTRCRRCLLPDVTPGIQFNAEGICNICTTHVPIPPKGEPALLEELSSIPTADSPSDCIVPISGGFDSFYTAYYLTRRLRLRCIGVHYDHGFGSESKERMLSWQEDRLSMPIIRVSWTREKTARLLVESIRALLPFGPKYLQAAICRHCGYGIRAAAYSEMARLNIHSVWGMHSMDDVPFRYCLDTGHMRYVFQSSMHHAVQALRWRWLQMRDIPSPGASAVRLLARGFGYPKLPEKLSYLKILRFFDFVSWDKERMLKELYEAGVDTDAFEVEHSDCSLAPVVDHILRAAWGLGKAEIYVCNRVRVGQLEQREGRLMIETLREERPTTSVLEQIGLRRDEIERLFYDSR